MKVDAGAGMKAKSEEIDKDSNRSVTSMILDCEEEEAKKALLEKYKSEKPDFVMPVACDRRLIVALHVRPEQVGKFKNEITGEEKSFILPGSIRKDDKYMSCTGCVLSVGPDAYMDSKWYRSGPLCKVGDFIVFPRHAGEQYNYMDIPVHNIPEDAVRQVLVDPSHANLY